MKSVTSCDMFGSLLKDTKNGIATCFDNIYLLPSAITSACGEGRLFYETFAQGIFFLKEETANFRLMFCSSCEEAADLPKTGKPCTVDLVYRNAAKEAKLAPVKAWLKKSGAVSYRRYMQMSGAALSASVSPAEGFSFSHTAPYGALISLWNEALDPVSTPLPTEAEFASLERDGAVFAVTDGGGRALAALIMLKSGRTALLQHVATAPDMRKKGLARALIAHAVAQVSAASYLLWVDTANTPAVNLYRSLGFAENGVASDQFIINRETI